MVGGKTDTTYGERIAVRPRAHVIGRGPWAQSARTDERKIIAIKYVLISTE
jgi:hypothetical protein